MISMFIRDNGKRKRKLMQVRFFSMKVKPRDCISFNNPCRNFSWIMREYLYRKWISTFAGDRKRLIGIYDVFDWIVNNLPASFGGRWTDFHYFSWIPATLTREAISRIIANGTTVAFVINIRRRIFVSCNAKIPDMRSFKRWANQLD